MATREEKVARLDELKKLADEEVLAYNKAMREKRFEDAKAIEKSLLDHVGEYGVNAQNLCFCDCAATPDPMHAAVIRLTFPIIAAVDIKADDDLDSDITTRTIVRKDKPIDLLKLHKHCGSIGKDENWHHIAQKMNFLLTMQKANGLGVKDYKQTIGDYYDISEYEKQIELGKNPTSNTQLLKTLQTVITAMVGDEYKATSHDVEFLKSVYSKKGRKALSVACANKRNFVAILMEVCHKIILGKAYTVEFKEKKQKTR